MEPLTGGDKGRALFAALLSGEWSLVGSLERNGEHHYLAERNDPERARERALTPDEQAVVRRVVTGTSYEPIAAELGVAATTVATRLSRALEKLGLESRAQLIVIAGRLGVTGSMHPAAIEPFTKKSSKRSRPNRGTRKS